MAGLRAVVVAALALSAAPSLSAQSPLVWRTQLHGKAFGMYVSQNTVRSADDFAAVGWLMAEVTGAGAYHEIGLRAMVSLDPLTLGDCGPARILIGAWTSFATLPMVSAECRPK